MPKMATTVRPMRITLAAIARPEVQRAGLAEQPVHEHGQRRGVGTHDEDGGAELAERDREREAGRDEQRARATIGRSTSRQTRAGDAPSVAAASRRRGSMARSTGVTMRTTNGTATSAWAIGISHDEPRKSNGAWSSAMRKPKPTVTADTPSGSERSVSRPRRRDAASANAPHPPTTTASTVAIAANRSELAMASTGGTNSVLPACTSPRAR